MTSGIHHVTLITRRVQANVDFYAGFLGLRLVKRTGGFEDAEQLHLFYGDATGSPGSVITFLVWEDGAAGRVGHGRVGEVAFAVPPASIGFWMQRALADRVPVEGPRKELGETVLRLKDPDGVIVKLVGADLPATAPWAGTVDAAHAVRRIRSVTLLSETPEETGAFLARFGYRPAQEGDSIRRWRSDTDVVDVRDATGFWPGIPGTGVADHVAFRVPDIAALEAMEADLARLNSTETTAHDRKYFASLYVREPGGTLIEVASDGPGFTVDEPPETLGTTLMIPPDQTARAAELRLILPQFSLPEEPRMRLRDLPFVHRFHTPEDPDGSTIVLLHGTGGNEADLMPFAHAIAPRATLLGVRGRSTEEGVARWFRRNSMTTFDQADIRSEAEAFAAFVDGAVRGYGLDADRLVFLGYSNGANLLGALLLLHPGVVRRAVLIRAMAVLEDAPQADLSGTEVLMLTGATDPYGPYAPALETSLRQAGATVEARTIRAGHNIAPADQGAVREWLGA